MMELFAMNQPNPADIVKNVVGIGGTVLLAPVAPPILHGLAGLALVGFGAFAVGSIVMKAGSALTGIGNIVQPKSTSNPGD
jgi:hypothetical protein